MIRVKDIYDIVYYINKAAIVSVEEFKHYPGWEEIFHKAKSKITFGFAHSNVIYLKETPSMVMRKIREKGK